MSLSFEATVGPLLVFVCIAFMLYGTFVAQLFFYYISYEGDATPLKIYVWIMGLLETSHTVLCVVFLYWYLIVRFGNAEEGIELIHWHVFPNQPFYHGLILLIGVYGTGDIVYCYFGDFYGLYGTNVILLANLARERQNHPHDSCSGFLVFNTNGFGIEYIPLSPDHLQTPKLTKFYSTPASFGLMADLRAWQMIVDDQALQGTLTATYAVELASDASISALLVYGLWKRRTTKFARTNEVIQRLVYYVLNTGVANIICSAAVIITFNLMRESLAFAGIIEMRSKLYANVMMALLNSRQILLKNRDIQLPTLSSSRNRETRVHIFTDTIVRNDFNDGEDHHVDVKPAEIITKG